MKVQFRERDVNLSKALRAHVQRRLGLALGRFAGRIGPVVVRFSDIGGDKRCQIDVGLRPRKVRVENTNADMLAAVNHASDRVSNSVARALDRERWDWDGGGTGPRTPGGSGT
jgi:putative sigma-54 modulation protein